MNEFKFINLKHLAPRISGQSNQLLTAAAFCYACLTPEVDSYIPE